jgi:hypothetical protein
MKLPGQKTLHRRGEATLVPVFVSDPTHAPELVSLRVAELPILLAKHTGPDGWSV